LSLHAIVSYDDTANDHDALMLGRVLADAGAQLTLAYVRHSMLTERSREQLEEHEAQELLERGVRWLGDLTPSRRVVLSASTGEGLRRLAEQADAQVIIFGSDYRTAPGHVVPGRSAQTLLEGGPAAIAVAPAGFRSRNPRIRTIGLLAGADNAASETAQALAESLGADVTREHRHAELLIVGSRPEAAEGRVLITAQAQNEIENSVAPVLVLARGVPLTPRTLVAV
jgi:nucleotide-binding universal stress UspA family protein